MKFGLFVAPFDEFANVNSLADLAVEAESSGWDGVFVYDHIARPEPVAIADPTVALSAIAVRTTRIRFGPMVLPLARRRPWKVAREAASLDQASGGRLILGVGLGHRGEEFDAFGDAATAKERAGRVDEGLGILSDLLTGTALEHIGRYYRVSTGPFLPTPIQSPRIPIWIAGRWPTSTPFRRAARWDGVFPLAEEPGRILSPAEIGQIVRLVARWRTSPAPFDVVQLGCSQSLGPRWTQEIRAYRDEGTTWWLEDVHPRRYSARAQGLSMAEAVRNRVRHGPPDSL